MTMPTAAAAAAVIVSLRVVIRPTVRAAYVRAVIPGTGLHPRVESSLVSLLRESRAAHTAESARDRV
jgi:hypothetical protein